MKVYFWYVIVCLHLLYRITCRPTCCMNWDLCQTTSTCV